MLNSPMCLDSVWAKWAVAWASKKPFETDQVGLAYMLTGDDGVSNVDPYAKSPTPDNEWVEEGPHLMLLVPNSALVKSLPDDPDTGGPYVMWKGTEYEHVMIPVH